eukprot:1144566-Pelagomonas_calceolata.AAC.3
MSTFTQYRPTRSGVLYPKDTLHAPNLTCIHASRESICLSQPEHGMLPVRQMVLRCEVPNPSTTSRERGTHVLSSGLRVALFCEHAQISEGVCTRQKSST